MQYEKAYLPIPNIFNRLLLESVLEVLEVSVLKLRKVKKNRPPHQYPQI